MSHWAGSGSACQSLGPSPAVLAPWLLPAATHNNFSFNFSILSVIYTCHATAWQSSSVQIPVAGIPLRANAVVFSSCFQAFFFRLFFLFLPLSACRTLFVVVCHRVWLYPAFFRACPTAVGGLQLSINSNTNQNSHSIGNYSLKSTCFEPFENNWIKINTGFTWHELNNI